MEVFLVAIVIAVGVRSYFLQPFTIPTGSMQPTLNGIIAYETGEPPPNILKRVLDFVVHGRTYINEIADEEDVILPHPEHGSLPRYSESRWLRFFTFTRIYTREGSFSMYGAAKPILEGFRAELRPGRRLEKGEVIVRGYLDTGDHVFVDKVSYNFRHPRRDEIFVFTTRDVPVEPRRDWRIEGSQYYIKRLVALPDDLVRIDPPLLYVNDAPAQGPGMKKVMSEESGYGGYVTAMPGMRYANVPGKAFKLPDNGYFALGDNSDASQDSRYWGIVPERNIVGSALMVYWPFADHWGDID